MGKLGIDTTRHLAAETDSRSIDGSSLPQAAPPSTGLSTWLKDHVAAFAILGVGAALWSTVDHNTAIAAPNLREFEALKKTMADPALRAKWVEQHERYLAAQGSVFKAAYPGLLIESEQDVPRALKNLGIIMKGTESDDFSERIDYLKAARANGVFPKDDPKLSALVTAFAALGERDKELKTAKKLFENESSAKYIAAAREAIEGAFKDLDRFIPRPKIGIKED